MWGAQAEALGGGGGGVGCVRDCTRIPEDLAQGLVGLNPLLQILICFSCMDFLALSAPGTDHFYPVSFFKHF